LTEARYYIVESKERWLYSHTGASRWRQCCSIRPQRKNSSMCHQHP